MKSVCLNNTFFTCTNMEGLRAYKQEPRRVRELELLIQMCGWVKALGLGLLTEKTVLSWRITIVTWQFYCLSGQDSMTGQLIGPRSTFVSFISTKLPSNHVCLHYRLAQLSVIMREGSSFSGQWLIETLKWSKCWE